MFWGVEILEARPLVLDIFRNGNIVLNIKIRYSTIAADLKT
jgi:hypothetical protein